MNQNHQLLQSLYSSASGRYLKFKIRLDKAIHNGRFHKLNKRKQSSLISRLKRLYERLKSLQTQLRIAGASAAFALTLSVSNPAQAQNSVGPIERNDDANPLPPPFSIQHPRLAVVDIDNDGDLDIFAGTGNGDVEFFRNTGGPTIVKRFSKITDSANPLGGVNKGSRAAPAFMDVDGDLDFDMLLGTGYGNTYFFRNTGSRTNPIFTEQTGASNPFDGITGTTNKYGTQESIPVFVDIDGDSDLDLFIGSSYSSDLYGGHDAVQFFENSAGNFAPSSHNLTGYVRYFNSAAITFADIDENGELDFLVSDGFGSLRAYVECGGGEFCEQIGPWDPVARTGNPMNYSYFYYGSPVLADFDGDGDLDLVVGHADNDYTSVVYYQNTDGAYTFENQNDLNISPLGGVDVGAQAAPTFVDLDNDGDLDAVIGAKYSNPDLYVYINEDGEFTADPDHPLVEILEPSFAYDVIPVFVDIDDDGDQDLFIWNGYQLEHFVNDAGTFEPASSPLNVDGDEVSVAFIDIDNDNDFDALVGRRKYGDAEVIYFENDGTAENSSFVSATPPVPFDNSIFEDYSNNVAAVDLDNDGDLDLAVTETYYTGIYGSKYASHTRYFENNNDGTFTEHTSSPIIEEESPPLSFIAFADIDNDGDQDAFLGNGDYNYDFDESGTVTYFENTDPTSNGPGLNVYNGFSPNKDDLVNSFFEIGNIESIYPENKVTIFNRWGDIVFDVTDYDNTQSSKRFEGVSNNGKDLPSGTYYYKIETKSKTFTGYLSLKR